MDIFLANWGTILHQHIHNAGGLVVHGSVVKRGLPPPLLQSGVCQTDQQVLHHAHVSHSGSEVEACPSNGELSVSFTGSLMLVSEGV